MYNEVNAGKGYPAVGIYSPMEMIANDRQEEI